MNKEIAIKVKVEGQEVTMAGRQLDNFKKTIESLKAQLKALGDRTEANGEQFDKLKGDLDALNATFGETSTEVQDTNDSLKQNDEQVQQNEKTTKSYTAQIRDLTKQLVALGDRTEQNGAQYDSLQARIKELRDKQEDLQFGTRKLDDSLSALPGPIGQVASSFKNYDDTLKNAKAALKGLTTQFTILKNAIAATGIGALVIIFGLLVAAVMKAFDTFKPLQQAVGKLGIVFDLIGQTIQPLVDLIGKGLTYAIEGFAKALAWVTGNTDAYIKKQEELKRATKGYTAEAEEEVRALERRAVLAKGKEKEMLELEIEFKKKRIENAKKYNEELTKLREEEGYKEGLKGTEEYYRKLNILDENYAIEDQKLVAEANKNIITLNNVFIDELTKLQNEKNVLLIKKDKDKELELLKQQKQAQDKEIKQLSISEEEKVRLLGVSGQIYLLKQKEINNKYAKEQKEAEEDLRKTIRDIRIGIIIDDKERTKAEADARRDDALQAVNELKVTEQLKADYVLAIWEKYYADLDKVQKDASDKNIELIYKQIEFERQSRQIGFQNQLDLIEIFGTSYVDKIKHNQDVLDAQAKETYDKEIENLTKLLTAKEITQAEFNSRSQELSNQYNIAILQNELKTQEQIVEAKMNMVNEIANIAGLLGGLLSELGQNNKELAIAGVIVEKAAAIAQIVANTAIANAKAVAAFPITAGQPWVTINTIAAGLSIATLIAAAANSISQIKSANGNSSATSAGGTQTPNYGKNYADGGEIKGRRHAQGGTLIEAEDGEAIMTRGAVAMFRPMLSLMNSMGGGKSFDARIVKPDNPITKQVNQEPIIMKTYVVESELTSEQNKQARLKNLSTI